jgi:hypothetical protein
MELVADLKRQICALFEVHSDQSGVQRIITPLEYAGSGDRIVVRVRRSGGQITIDENGDAAMFAAMAGGDTESDVIARWAVELNGRSPASFGDDEVISAHVTDERLIAAYIFRVAEAAQHLHSLATAKISRQASDFKERVASVILETAKKLNAEWSEDVELPIAGGLVADFVIDQDRPLIIIAATSATRLLEAEIIHMQYRLSKIPGFVLAVAESQSAVGKKQFERANYYTDKTVSFSPSDLEQLITTQLH